MNGDQVHGDFGETGHFIAVGTTGSGLASYSEGAFVTSLIEKYTPNELQLVMVDPKQVQLTSYVTIPHLWRPIAQTPSDADTAVTDLLDEIDRRFDLLVKAGVINIGEYNDQPNHKLPFIILICTEIADLIMVNKPLYERVFDRIWMVGRAVGIHMFIATQNTSEDVLRDGLLGGVSGRLLFKVHSALESERLIGETGAEKIKEAGRLVYSESPGLHLVDVKAAYVTDEEIMNIVDRLKESK